MNQELVNGTAVGNRDRTSVGWELGWLAVILILGLIPRLLFVTFFPTTPISDFLALLNFAIVFRDDWIAWDAWQWRYFSPGLSFLLSIVLRFVHETPEAVGRWTTALLTGLVPVLPYLGWRNVFPLRTRILAALLLSLWPNQILFSSVLAQDNWVIFPTVAVVVLAVRALAMRQDPGAPVLSAVVYAVSTAIRQEMMIALLPATVVAIAGYQRRSRLRNLVVGASIISLAFAALILQRGLATGSYTLRSEHVGKAILGAYVPGAGMGWIDPIPYVKSAYPQLVKDGDLDRTLAQEGLKITWHEFMTRPRFHAIRIFGSTLTNLLQMDEQLLWWSLGEEALLPRYQKNASVLITRMLPLLRIHPVLIHMLFASSLFFALKHRSILNWLIPILMTIALKVGMHAIVVSQPRYYLVVIAVEMLAIAVVWDGMLKRENWKISFRSIMLGIVSVLILVMATNYARDYVQTHDIVLQTQYMVYSHTRGI